MAIFYFYTILKTNKKITNLFCNFIKLDLVFKYTYYKIFFLFFLGGNLFVVSRLTMNYIIFRLTKVTTVA